MSTEKVFEKFKRGGSFEQLKDLSNVVGPHGIGFGSFKFEVIIVENLRENLKKAMQ